MPEIVGAGAGNGGAGAGAGTGAGPVTGGNPGAGPGASGAGSGEGVRPGPTKISLAFDEGGTPSEFSFDDAEGGGEAGAPAADFKFEQLDPLREGEHAELYKTLKAELSAKSRFAKVFKSPEELSQHMDKVNRLSEYVGKRADGKTGLDAVESTIRELGDVFGKLQNGDPGVVEQWFKDNPAGMASLAEHSLANLAKTDTKLHASLIGRAAVSVLTQKDASGFSAVDAFNAIYGALKELPAGSEAVRDKLLGLLNRTAHTLNQLGNDAEYKPDQTNIVEAKNKALAKRETDLWNKETDLQVEDVLRPAAGKLLSSLLTQLNKLDVTAEERQEYRAAMLADFYTEAGKDATFVSKLNALRKANDRAGILQLIRDNRAKFLGAAAKNLYRSKLLNRKGAQKEGAGKNEGAAGSVTPTQNAVKYTGKIHPERGPMVDFDYARMSAEGIEALDRKFYIKGRKELFTW